MPRRMVSPLNSQRTRRRRGVRWRRRQSRIVPPVDLPFSAPSATSGRQAKPGRSCGMKGAHHVIACLTCSLGRSADVASSPGEGASCNASESALPRYTKWGRSTCRRCRSPVRTAKQQAHAAVRPPGVRRSGAHRRTGRGTWENRLRPGAIPERDAPNSITVPRRGRESDGPIVARMPGASTPDVGPA